MLGYLLLKICPVIEICCLLMFQKLDKKLFSSRDKTRIRLFRARVIVKVVLRVMHSFRVIVTVKVLFKICSRDS